MPVIQVTKDFVFTLEDGAKRAFQKGEHEVEDAIAQHWYVQAHSKPVASPVAASEPAPATTALPASGAEPPKSSSKNK